MKVLTAAASIAALAYPTAGTAQTPTRETQSLRDQLKAAEAEIAAQRARLEAQEARLRALEERITASERAAATVPTPRAPSTVAQATPSQGVASANAAPLPGVERVGERPAERDRPPEVAVLGSEGSVVTRKGQLTTEFQLDYARSDRNRALFRGIELVEAVLVGEFDINESRQDIISASGALRYGVTDRFEISTRVPLVRRSDTSVLVPVQGSTNNDAAREINTSAKGFGMGDIEISARYQLLTGRRGLPFLVGNLQVIAPTGTSPFAVPRNARGVGTRAATGAGFWGVTPSLTAIVQSDPAVLFGTIGYTRNFGRNVNTDIPPVRIEYVKPGDSLAFSGGIGVALNERTSLNLGYAQTWSFGTLTRTRAINPTPANPGVFETRSRDLQLGRLLLGVTYRATEKVSVNWSVEVGATDDATDVRTVLRIPLVLITGGR
ncbi:MAG: transporter [Sphingomonadaceae bacterium]